ncbi:MAG: hypothetical protein L0Y66_26735 [Myxococcaceae bacterium]|nr:hypothetical protein [Myxococcaceae bacterium]MCI0671101.1 hypothetical protein [Myxococcaceae bacterium]
MYRTSLLLLLLLSLACGRIHLLQEGRYQMSATEVLTDTCGVLAQPDDLWDGSLLLMGNVVRFDYELLQPPIPMSGVFLSRTERFTANGTALNTPFRVRGRDCLVGSITVTINADTDEGAEPPGTVFTGTLRVHVETRGTPEDEACTCEVAATLRAVHE